MKLLIWLVLAWFAVMWFMHLKKLKVSGRGAHAQRAAADSAASSSPARSEPMLPCAHCGVFLPGSEAITSPDGSLAWCCEEHRLQHPH